MYNLPVIRALFPSICPSGVETPMRVLIITMMSRFASPASATVH